MEENLLEIRERANVKRKTVSKLLNISVCTYLRYENHKWEIPAEIASMFCKMFHISQNELYGSSKTFSLNTVEQLGYIRGLSEREQELYFMENLVDEPVHRLSYVRIEAVKKQIQKDCNTKETG